MEQEERERFNIRNILNERAVKNAFVVDMAMGGSSNTILHHVGNCLMRLV